MKFCHGISFLHNLVGDWPTNACEFNSHISLLSEIVRYEKTVCTERKLYFSTDDMSEFAVCTSGQGQTTVDIRLTTNEGVSVDYQNERTYFAGEVNILICLWTSHLSAPSTCKPPCISSCEQPVAF